MTFDSHGDLTQDDVAPPRDLPRRSGSTIWKEPLTEGERAIIANVLAEGDLVVTRQWLRFCLEILNAQTAG